MSAAQEKPKTWLSVRQWNAHQHYQNRRPPWIKLYTRMLDDLELRALPIATQLLWDRLLLLAARYDNAILNDSESIANATGIPRKQVANGIDALLKGRWLSETKGRRRASKPLASRKQKSMPETEIERETPKPPFRKNGEVPSVPTHICRVCTIGFRRPDLLADHLANVHGIEPKGATT